jgi:DNA-binding MarR family transcriptional regulator
MSTDDTSSHDVSHEARQDSPDPRVRAGVPDYLEDEGFSDAAIEALLALDLSLFQWRRMAEKGEFKGKVLEGMSEKLEPAILQGLLSIAQITAGLGRDVAEPPTIGMVAEVMAVDPSRASRIVSELVSRGYVIRQAVQEDARKSVLVITPKARTFLRAFTLSKWRLFSQAFTGWSGEEIATFSDLFGRYVGGLLVAVSEPAQKPAPDDENI